jgi:propionyl-CoA carboxylase alpha chain
VITRLLVANRDEIARRIIATARAMGITTIAVCSDPDHDAPHVTEADLAVRLSGSAPSQTYLDIGAILDAARRTGADAVHPGYGFLSENADFATAVTDAALTWVGPPSNAIAAMGAKLAAKRLVAAAGVPVFESWRDPSEVTAYPVLVKASAGGGGRGMRVVTAPADLAAALAAAGREAAGAFGDGAVFAEPYVPSGRHVEVQVFADTHGTVVALGERECSIQRRHQKLIEETPSPAVDATLRAALFSAAVAAARAVGYVGAGTVEFLLAPDGRFVFLEMNTRLQVEHPVTECVTGLDLVRLQLEVAEGRPLPFTATPPARGHAIEARLYAEDPTLDWRPAPGPLHRFAVPAATVAFAPPTAAAGVRLDAGVTDGSTVDVHYDPLLGKVVAWAPTRDEAVRRLAAALAGAVVHGVATNRDLLVRVLRTDGFRAGDTDTAFLDRHPAVFAPLLERPAPRRLAGLAAALAGVAARREQAPWAALPVGWRPLMTDVASTVAFDAPWGRVEVRYTHVRGELAEWSVDGDTDDVRVVRATPDEVVLDVATVRHAFTVHRVGDVSYVDTDAGSVALVEVPRFAGTDDGPPAGTLVAPMPGAVGTVAVRPGDHVAAGDLLLTLEAMKLEHAVRAPHDGMVAGVRVVPGEQVPAGAVLAVLDPVDDVVLEPVDDDQKEQA